MQISKKKNNTKLLGAILVLCVFFTSGCSKEEVSQPVEPQVTQETIQIDPSLLNAKVTANAGASLYNQDGVVVGSLTEGTLLETTTEVSNAYISLMDSSYYVKADEITKSDRWVKFNTHILPYSKELMTKDTYRIYDEKGNVWGEVHNTDTYPLYVQLTTTPSEAREGLYQDAYEEYYGVKIQNQILYISSNDIASIQETSGTTVAVATEVPVMMYHFFYSEENGETRQDVNYVEVNELDEQCNALVSNGYTALTMRELEYFLEGKAQVPDKSVVISIDDGDPTVYKYAYPVLTKYNLNATLFLICGWEDPTMNYEFVEMRENGLELQSHGFLMHQGGCSGMGHGGRLLCIDHNEGVQDTIQSFEYVDHGFVYCYPFGDVNEEGKSIVKEAGAKLAFTTAWGITNPSMDLLELPRIRVTGGNGLEAYMKNLKGSE